MESASTWEYKMLVDELTQGLEQAKQLRVQLSSVSSCESQNLLQRIMSSYEKALLILKWNGPVGQSSLVTPTSGAPESSLSADGSPRSENLNKSVKVHHEYSNVSKKRKGSPTWTQQVRVSSDSGLEGPGDDGYSWRKYGQKDILGAKYPRSYYRCTYRLMQNCWATKQVQRSDDDPSVFEITYKGTHTCNLASNLVHPPTSPEKHELKHSYHHNNNESPQPNQMLMNLRANLRVKTDDLETKENGSPFSAPPTFTSTTGENQVYSLPMLADGDLLGTYSPSFMSPGTSESNYYSISPCQMNGFGGFHDLHHSESDPTGIFSATNSSTNSPIVGLEFLIEPVGSDPHFPFHTPGFFP